MNLDVGVLEQRFRPRGIGQYLTRVDKPGVYARGLQHARTHLVLEGVVSAYPD